MVKCDFCSEDVPVLVVYGGESMCPECQDHFLEQDLLREAEEEDYFKSLDDEYPEEE